MLALNLRLKQLEDSQSERNQKYRKLRKQEATMEQFFETFEQNRSEEILKLETTEREIVKYLEKISKNQSLIGHMPR